MNHKLPRDSLQIRMGIPFAMEMAFGIVLYTAIDIGLAVSSAVSVRDKIIWAPISAAALLLSGFCMFFFRNMKCTTDSEGIKIHGVRHLKEDEVLLWQDIDDMLIRMPPNGYRYLTIVKKEANPTVRDLKTGRIKPNPGVITFRATQKMLQVIQAHCTGDIFRIQGRGKRTP